MTTAELKQKIGDLLPNDPVLAKFRENRKRDGRNPYMPAYHFHSPGGYMNDPCGYCFYKGLYHLFYQFEPEETGKLGWGHAVSVDGMTWLDLPPAVMPTIEICCGSGGVYTEENRAVMCYQGNLIGSESGAIHICQSTDDLLIRWERVTALPVIYTLKEDGTPNPYVAFDPYLWKDGDTYYLLSAGGGSLPHPTGLNDPDFRREYLFTSKDLIRWEYRHPFLEEDRFADIGDDGACPYFLPLGDSYMMLHFSHRSGGKYLIGRYDKEALKFHAGKGGSFNSNSWSGGVHAPSAFGDGDRNIHAVFNMNYGMLWQGVNQIMSLPRLFTPGGEYGFLQAPDGGYAALRGNAAEGKGVLLPANREIPLPDVRGKALEIGITVERREKKSSIGFIPDNLLPVFELKVLCSPDHEEYTAIRFYRNRSVMNWGLFRSAGGHWANAMASIAEVDTSHSSLGAEAVIHPTETAEVLLPTEDPIRLHVFVDRSIVEVFVDGQKCIGVRVYPTRTDSTGVTALVRGVDAVMDYRAWNMKDIYHE